MSDPQQTSPENLELQDTVQPSKFRVLIIGSANAGKTTILNKVCNRKTDLDTPTSEGRNHDIEEEVYSSAHGLIFHDSRGFQAGRSDELEKVKDFIRRRSEQKEWKDQLHVIWHCLRTDGDRSLPQTDMSLLESGTENIPVVAILTKLDCIHARAFNELKSSGLSFSNAKKQLPLAAKAMVERNYLEPLKKVKHPPARIVQLRNMHNADTNCDDLIEVTARVLREHSEALKGSYSQSEIVSKDVSTLP